MNDKKVYLREVSIIEGKVMRKRFDIFEGNVCEDRKYWKKYHGRKARYFELKEVKEDDI